MPGIEVLSEHVDFSGGHWGIGGPDSAAKDQWGGINVVPTRQGGVAPVSASRILDTDAVTGKVWGVFWAWGVDGLVYFLQQGTGVGDGVFTVRRFDPDPTGAITVVDVDDILGTAVVLPDWLAFGPDLYMTVYGDETYAIDPTGPTLGKLTGSDGDAPAGRCMCVYRERMIVGGVNDDRFGDHPNRFVYSGSSADDVPFDVTRWPSTQIIDIGPDDGTYIAALLPLRDQLVIIMSDQSWWSLTGTLGVNETLRRVHGFHKGSGAITDFDHHHAGIDPAQTRVWAFDHARRGPVRFNGAQVVAVPAFGVPSSNRTGAGAVQGAMTMIGGPDEFVMDRVAMPLPDGGTFAANRHVMLARIGSSFFLVDADVIANRP